jgi:predicted kinase
VYSSDYIRKKLAGFPLYERSSNAARARLYSTAMTEQTYDLLLASAEEQAHKRRGIILDATFARRAHRDLLEQRFGKRGIAYRILEAQAEDLMVKQRLSDREAKRDEISDARLEDFEMLTSLYEPPCELPAIRCARIQTFAALEETVTNALKSLSQIQLDSLCQSP